MCTSGQPQGISADIWQPTCLRRSSWRRAEGMEAGLQKRSLSSVDTSDVSSRFTVSLRCMYTPPTWAQLRAERANENMARAIVAIYPKGPCDSVPSCTGVGRISSPEHENPYP